MISKIEFVDFNQERHFRNFFQDWERIVERLQYHKYLYGHYLHVLDFNYGLGASLSQRKVKFILDLYNERFKMTKDELQAEMFKTLYTKWKRLYPHKLLVL